MCDLVKLPALLELPKCVLLVDQPPVALLEMPVLRQTSDAAKLATDGLVRKVDPKASARGRDEPDKPLIHVGIKIFE